MSGALGCIASYVAPEVVPSWCDAWRDEFTLAVALRTHSCLTPDISLTQSHTMVAVQEVRELTSIYAKQGDTLDLTWNDNLS
jgi:phage host-nuclease inhibitor protein Gam